MYTCFSCKKIINNSETLYMFLDNFFCSNKCRKFYNNITSNSMNLNSLLDLEDSVIISDTTSDTKSDTKSDTIESLCTKNNFCVIL